MMGVSLSKVRAAVIAALFFGSPVAKARPPSAPRAVELLNATCSVVGISDGDTFKARCPYEQIRIRFAGMDAPESGQEFGQVSKAYLSQLIFGKSVRVVQSKAAPSYDRIVANVYDLDGQDVGLKMVAAGLAWHYKQFAHEQTLSARWAYMRAESAAREQKLGIWIQPHPIPPWEWRHEKQN